MIELGQKYSRGHIIVEPEYEGSYFVELEDDDKKDYSFSFDVVYVRFVDYTKNCTRQQIDSAILYSTAPSGMLFELA